MKPLQDLADRQWRDYRARQPGTCFADPNFVLSLADAYELQDAVAKLRVAAGDRLIGYKVGCTGTGTVQQFGMQGPIRGCLFKSEVRKDGDVLIGWTVPAPGIDVPIKWSLLISTTRGAVHHEDYYDWSRSCQALVSGPRR